jgi:hypothetical protein
MCVCVCVLHLYSFCLNVRLTNYNEDGSNEDEVEAEELKGDQQDLKDGNEDSKLSWMCCCAPSPGGHSSGALCSW